MDFNRARRLHNDEDEIPISSSTLARRENSATGHPRLYAIKTTERTGVRRCASQWFSEALEGARMGHEEAARAIGTSRQLVGAKADEDRAEVASLADMIDLIDAGGRGVDVGETIARRLLDRCNVRRGAMPPDISLLPRVALFAVSVMGQLATELATLHGAPSEQARGRLLVVCGSLHAQLAQLEACVRGPA